ncbi:hypothetical protein [Sphingobacterium thalpophilum]|uniref:hypothetical protein n=1 Tax=Sphingobacterium thalpophilum TaxID=259 RepID=UPI0010FEB422|nr:hypothetical protein [Sphingobacterium thalpophilum]
MHEGIGDTPNKYTAFWTNDRLLGTPLIGLGVNHFLGHTATGLLSVLPPATDTGFRSYRSTNALAIDLLGSINVVKSSLMNVRCVRNTAWNGNAPGYNPNPVLPD